MRRKKNVMRKMFAVAVFTSLLLIGCSGLGDSGSGGGGAELLSADAVKCNMQASLGIGTEILAVPIETLGRSHGREYGAKTN